jgi:hypothetical protein
MIADGTFVAFTAESKLLVGKERADLVAAAWQLKKTHE